VLTAASRAPPRNSPAAAPDGSRASHQMDFGAMGTGLVSLRQNSIKRLVKSKNHPRPHVLQSQFGQLLADFQAFFRRFSAFSVGFY
jgi:hypothetical protein